MMGGKCLRLPLFKCEDFKMSKNVKNDNTSEETERLAKAFLSLSDVDECKAFFGDLLTVKEIEELSSRLEVARLLKLGVNYIEIAARTGASTATISRVSKCLSGSRGGYRMVLSRAEENPEPSDECSIRTDSLTPDEAAAVRAVIACFRAKK